MLQQQRYQRQKAMETAEREKQSLRYQSGGSAGGAVRARYDVVMDTDRGLPVEIDPRGSSSSKTNTRNAWSDQKSGVSTNQNKRYTLYHNNNTYFIVSVLINVYFTY